MHEPDPDLVDSAAQGDLDAFTTIMRDTQPDVWRFIHHLVGDRELSEDLTQETFVRVYRSIGTFRGDSLFGTWLFRIARNVAIDAQRKRRRGSTVPLNADSTAIIDQRSGPAERAEIRAAVAALPELQRSALILVEVFGLKYREAAEILEVSDGTVKSRVFNARARLAKWFDDIGEDERVR